MRQVLLQSTDVHIAYDFNSLIPVAVATEPGQPN